MSLTSNTNLVTKVHFPREIFPFSVGAGVRWWTWRSASIVLVGMMVYYGVGISTGARSRCR